MSGTVGPRISPFINTYSLDFDGMDDKVELGTQSLGITGAISVSAWVKIPISGVWAAPYVQGICVENGTSGINWALYFRPPPFFNFFAFQIYHTNGTSTTLTSSGVTPNDGQWHHLLATSDGTTNANSVKLFVDGVLNVQATATSTGTKSTPTVIPTIGSTSNNSWYFEGNIDEVSVFNTDQSSNIATLSTAPTVDLTSLNPIAWYRMGDNGAYKDPQWLIPSNENKDKVSNYSMEFDGVNDYIEILPNGLGSIYAIQEYSIEFWFRTSFNGPYEVLWSYDYTTHVPPYYAQHIRINTPSDITVPNTIDFYTNTNGTALSALSTPNTISLSNSTWHHIVVTKTLTTKDIYLDGINVASGSYVSTPTTYYAQEVWVGRGNFSNGYTKGNFGFVKFYDSRLTQQNVTDIYNGGMPTDVPGVNPVSYWKMGEDSTFSGGVWTVPDAVGSNDGTSANMTIEDRVGTAPSSSNNALSFNMDLIDRVEDTPPTP